MFISDYFSTFLAENEYCVRTFWLRGRGTAGIYIGASSLRECLAEECDD